MPEGHIIFCLDTKNEAKKVKAIKITRKTIILNAKVEKLAALKQLALFYAYCGLVYRNIFKADYLL